MQTFIENSNQVFENQTWSGNEYARRMHEDGRPVHTFRTASVYLFGNHNVFRGCTFENTAGRGEDVGQAIALYVDGDENTFEDCCISGHQDTLFLAPLPPKEFEKDGFLGPRQFAPRTPRTTYFKDCVIEGGVDFIFGGGTAYFDHCTFVSNEPGYVFAPSTPEEVETGFICRDCRFVNGMHVETSESGMDAKTYANAGEHARPDCGIATCYIGRPWRNYAAVTLENCWLDTHIAPAGWHDWNKQDAHETVRFIEHGSNGPGANPAGRPAWVSIR